MSLDLQSALSALNEGKSAEEAAHDGGITDTASIEGDTPTPDSESTTDSTDILDQWSKGDEETPEKEEKVVEAKDSEDQPNEPEADEATDTPEAEAQAAEYIKADGKRIKVDYEDKDKIKRAYQLAAGMRKFQRERDDERKLREKTEERLGELETMFSKIENAASSNDTNELVRIMTGGKADFDTLVQERIEREKLRELATDDELKQMDLEERVKGLQAQLEKQREDFDSKVGSVKKDREQAELKALESKVHPAFDRYRFAGKLGDADAEQHFDEMLWNKAISNLENYSDITPEIVNKEFKAVQAVLDRVVNKQVEAKRKEVSTTRKKKAKETAQIEQVRGYLNNDTKKEAADHFKSGDITGLLKSWDKFGDLF